MWLPSGWGTLRTWRRPITSGPESITSRMWLRAAEPVRRTAQIAAQHIPEGSGKEPHKTPEPAATSWVSAGSSGIRPVIETDLVGSTGLEQPAFRAGNTAVAISCDAKCDAISANRIELLTRAVILVAGMNLAESERAAVLARVIADLTSPTTRIPE